MRLTTKIAAFALSLGLLASTSDAGLVLVIDDLGDGSSAIIVLDDADGGVGDQTGHLPGIPGEATDPDEFAGPGVVVYTGTVGTFVPARFL